MKAKFNFSCICYSWLWNVVTIKHQKRNFVFSDESKHTKCCCKWYQPCSPMRKKMVPAPKHEHFCPRCRKQTSAGPRRLRWPGSTPHSKPYPCGLRASVALWAHIPAPSKLNAVVCSSRVRTRDSSEWVTGSGEPRQGRFPRRCWGVRWQREFHFAGGAWRIRVKVSFSFLICDTVPFSTFPERTSDLHDITKQSLILSFFL